MDNVFIERLWRSLKYECVYLSEFATGSQARTGIGRWMDFYDRRRPHSSLNDRTPTRPYTDDGADRSPGLRPVSCQPTVAWNHDPGFHLAVTNTCQRMGSTSVTSFINPRAEVPGCTDPNRGSGAGWKTLRSRRRILAGLSAGYRFGGRLRVEAEWFHRESAYDQTAPVTSATGDTFAKLDGGDPSGPRIGSAALVAERLRQRVRRLPRSEPCDAVRRRRSRHRSDRAGLR